MRGKAAGKKRGAALAAVNLLCVVTIVALFAGYSAAYRAKLYSQNISSIENLNRSSAIVADAIFTFRAQKIRDAARCIEASGMRLDEALDYLGLMNDDPSGSFELVGQDAAGYFAARGKDGAFLPVSYKDVSYSELQRLFRQAGPQNAGTVTYTPEFTDAHTAFKSFAFYTSVRVGGAQEGVYCTLMFVSRSGDTMDALQQSGSYADLAVALIDPRGNYIIGSPDFKSENFFKYLYVFNGLSLDEMNELSAKVLSTASGTLTYRDGAGRDCVFVYNRHPDDAWYSVSCVPLASFDYPSYGNQLAVLVTVLLSVMLGLDILWLNRVNRQLKLSVTREKKANEAKTEFLSRMSHDIRTPLNAILGFTAITRESPLLAPPLQDNLRKIEHSGRYLLGVVNDVLDMAKIESGKVELRAENTDCAQLFGGILEIFTGEAQSKSIRLTTEFDFDEARFLVLDPLRTKQIFSNLLSNAVKFSDNGTEVHWSISAHRMPDGRVRLTSAVRDQGCGMSPEFTAKLFEPFSQERNLHTNDTAGTGLGLAIVHRLVDLMGGTVRVESALGKGTQFTVVLPLEAGVQPTQPDRQAEGGAAVLCGRRVLICEDNALNREIAAALLTSRGVLFDEAENGSAGVERFSASPVWYYDVILMDIRMPEMNGLQAARAIRALPRADAGVPIIAMTANAYDEDIRASAAAGMNAHLAKPFEPEELFAVLGRFAAEKHAASS